MSSNHPFVHRRAGSNRLSQDEVSSSTSEPIWMRPKEAADYLDSSESTLAKWRLRGDGPPYAKTARLVFYERHSIDRWLSDRLRRSTSEKEG